jgi:hypothetical protein
MARIRWRAGHELTTKKCCNTVMLYAALHNIVCLTRRKQSLMIDPAIAKDDGMDAAYLLEHARDH